MVLDDTLATEATTPSSVASYPITPATGEAFALIAKLCARNIPVLVCSSHDKASYVRRPLAAGALGDITKGEAPRELARTVRDLMDGWMLISPRAADGLR